MKNYYFTFGSIHKDKWGNPLEYAYIKIRAETEDQARQTMFGSRKAAWAFGYNEKEFLPQIDRYDLYEVKLEDI